MTTAPRWAVRTAHVVPLLTLPSGLWRIALVVGLPVIGLDAGSFVERFGIVLLSLVAEGSALLTLGLVQPWGEIVPRWIPLIGGRCVRPMAAVVPALIGAATLTFLWTWSISNMWSHGFFGYFENDAQVVLVVVCYLPLLAWGPLLAVVAVAYLRRRTTDRASVRPCPSRALRGDRG